MRLTDTIEKFLLDMLKDAQTVTLCRNEIAARFACAPSQITYVVDTRFTGQRGYIVESQRGGGGYIRIKRIDIDGDNYLMHVIGATGNAITAATVQAMLDNMLIEKVISKREMRIIAAALSDRAIPLEQPQRDIHRAAVFRSMLMSLM